MIGFPFWIAFAWFYEFTPHGIQRESDVAEDARSRHSTARKLDFAIIGILAVAVVLLGTNEFVLHRRGAVGTTFDPPTDSLVVLPFQNLGGNPSRQYFSDGITEELTGALGQNPALRVIAWDTAAKFRGGEESATEVGRQLNVANVLHGTIEREGSEVRISAELVDARTGYELWARHYDDTFANIFAVEDQVTHAIASAMQVKFAQTDLSTGGTRNPEAHELVLKGRALLEQHDPTRYPVAQKDFERAIELDPDYADAYAALAGALLDQTDYSDLSFKDTGPKARTLAKKALALDPRNARAFTVLGNLDLNELKTKQAQDEYRQALTIDPSNARTHVDYALTLPVKAGLAEMREAVMLNPRAWVAQMNLALNYAYLGDYRQMLVPAQAILLLSPKNVDGAFLLAFAYQQLHQDESAAKAFDLAEPSSPLDQLQVQAGRLTYQSLLSPALRPQAVAAVGRLRKAKLSPYSQRNLIQLYLALGETAPALQLLGSLCPSYPIACSDLTVFPMFRPLRNDPRFEQLSRRYTIKPLE
ncbi:MAG: hypothetical protein ACREP2_03710 [Rhodanobacteraceae bacterium]